MGIGRRVLWRGTQHLYCIGNPLYICVLQTLLKIRFFVVFVEKQSCKEQCLKDKEHDFLPIHPSIHPSLMYPLRFFRYCFNFSLVKIETLEVMSQKGVMQL